jgi:hypothetical protein
MEKNKPIYQAKESTVYCAEGIIRKGFIMRKFCHSHDYQTLSRNNPQTF